MRPTEQARRRDVFVEERIVRELLEECVDFALGGLGRRLAQRAAGPRAQHCQGLARPPSPPGLGQRPRQRLPVCLQQVPHHVGHTAHVVGLRRHHTVEQAEVRATEALGARETLAQPDVAQAFVGEPVHARPLLIFEHGAQGALAARGGAHCLAQLDAVGIARRSSLRRVLLEVEQSHMASQRERPLAERTCQKPSAPHRACSRASSRTFFIHHGPRTLNPCYSSARCCRYQGRSAGRAAGSELTAANRETRVPARRLSPRRSSSQLDSSQEGLT